MNQEFIGALKEIVKDKGISEDLLFTTIEDALVAAYKKNYAGPTSSAQNVKVTIDRETGEIHVYSQKIVVEEVFDTVTEIGLEEAQEIKPTYDLDDVVDFEVTPKNFGRVAAQLAKGVVTQRIREAERSIIYNVPILLALSARFLASSADNLKILLIFLFLFSILITFFFQSCCNFLSFQHIPMQTYQLLHQSYFLYH